MSRPFTGLVMLTAVLMAGWAGWAALRSRTLGPAFVAALACLQVLVVAHAVGAAVSLSGGHQASEPTTHAVYLGASLIVLPLLLGVPAHGGRRALDLSTFVGGINIGPPGQRPAGAADPWRGAVAGLGCVAVAVILSRMWVTWQAVGHG